MRQIEVPNVGCNIPRFFPTLILTFLLLPSSLPGATEVSLGVRSQELGVRSQESGVRINGFNTSFELGNFLFLLVRVPSQESAFP
ncbi:MAG: hypothetical protein F6K24_32780 [Okeania sp. SIO2D1]|nr:hypothetical protein [Okeania sp. SIO2D1]